jgi:hypothetical protein
MYGILGGMEKTTVYLTAQQKAALARAAEAEGRTEARLIRAGIDVVTARHALGEARVTLAADDLDLPREMASLDRPRWVDRNDFVRLVLHHQADEGLRTQLRDLVPGTTDDEQIA